MTVFLSYRNQLKTNLPKILIPFLLFYLWALATFFVSAQIDIFVYRLIALLSFYVAAWIVFSLDNKQSNRNLAYAILLCAVFESLFSVVNSIFFNQSHGYLGNRLHSSLLILGGLTVIFSLKEEKRWAKAAGIILIGAIILLKTRMAYICLFALPFLYLRKKQATHYLYFCVVVGVVLAILSSMGYLSVFRLSLDQISSALERWTIWKAAFMAFLQYPVFGVGLGQFEIAYYLFQQPTVDFLRFEKTTIFAHNGFLQVLSETGLPGAALLFSGFILFLMRLIRKKDYVLGWEEGLLFVFLLSSLTNYTTILPFSGMLLAVALISSIKKDPSKASFRFSLRPIYVCVVFLVALSFMILTTWTDHLKKNERFDEAVELMPIRSELWYGRALHYLNRTDLPEEKRNGLALYSLNESLRWNKKNPFYWVRLAIAKSSFQPIDKGGILYSFRQARELAPQHAPFYIQEGFYHLKNKDLPEAKKLFLAAHGLEPRTPLPVYCLGIIAYEERKMGKAKALFKEAVFLKEDYHQNYENDKNPSDYRTFLFAVPLEKMNNLIKEL